MLSLVALITAVLLAVTVEEGRLVWLGLTLFTLGLLPLAIALTRPVESGAGPALDRLTAPGRGMVALQFGSFFAQTGLLVTLIALIA